VEKLENYGLEKEMHASVWRIIKLRQECVFVRGQNISASMRPIGAKFCATVDLSSGQVFSTFGGDIFKGLHMRDQKGRGGRFWAYKKTFDSKYLENGKSQRNMSIRT